MDVFALNIRVRRLNFGHVTNIRRLSWAHANAADSEERSPHADTQYIVVDENSDQAPRL